MAFSDLGNITQLLIDVADGLLLGIPSSVLASDVANKFNLDIADVNRTITLLNSELNANADMMEAIANKQYDILRSISTTSPLGAWRYELQNKYRDLSAQREAENQKKSDLIAKLGIANEKLSKLERDANKSLGQKATQGDLF